jgi:Ribosomal protein L17
LFNFLFKYEQITTTLPKAKVLKPQADKIIPLGKMVSLSNKKKLIFKFQDKKSAKKVIENYRKDMKKEVVDIPE